MQVTTDFQGVQGKSISSFFLHPLVFGEFLISICHQYLHKASFIFNLPKETVDQKGRGPGSLYVPACISRASKIHCHFVKAFIFQGSHVLLSHSISF